MQSDINGTGKGVLGIMRKFVSILLILILTFSMAVLFTGCGETVATAESILKTDENFAGTRTINLRLPSNIKAANAIELLNKNMPDMDEYKGCLSVIDSSDSDHSNQITFTISFDSKEDYVNKVAQLLGNDVTVNMAKPDNILISGTRYVEDFDAVQLLSWITTVLESNYDVTKLNYDFESNVVDLGGSLFTTGTTAVVNEVEGEPIEKIYISTTNYKNNSYDREFVFEVSDTVHKSLGKDLDYYLDAITNELAEYKGWTNKGGIHEYKVIFKNLSVDELKNVTNQIMDMSQGSIAYGDFTNSSTPLSEGLIFEEQLNTLNYMGKDKSMVPVVYTYSVPTNTTHSEGSVLENGSWINKGTWQDYTYSLETNKGAEKIHIPDGIQYEISGMNFYLNNNGGDSFSRTVDILYAKDNENGVSYAYNFFKNKGANVTREEDASYYICRIKTDGTALEISKNTVEYFGGGNHLDYEYKENPTDISDYTNFVDYINIGYMLTAENMEKPMTYTVTKTGSENIVRVNVEATKGKQTLDRPNEESKYVVTFTGGNASVFYNGTIAHWGKVTLFTIVAVGLIMGAGALLLFYIRKFLKSEDKEIKAYELAYFEKEEKEEK